MISNLLISTYLVLVFVLGLALTLLQDYSIIGNRNTADGVTYDFT